VPPAQPTPEPKEDVPPPPAAAATPEPLPVIYALPAWLPWRIGLVLGLGTTFDDLPGKLNPLGLGIGARVDHRPLEDWIFGARFLYYFGGSENLSTGTYRTNAWLLTADAAYVINFNPVWLEPGLALGLYARAFDGAAALTTWGGSYVPSRQSGTQLGLYVAPTVRAVVPLQVFSQDLQQLYAACDLQVGFIFGQRTSSQLEFLLHAGMRF
jgi:hypothetical protein